MGESLQRPPTIKGMKNQVRNRNSWKMWKAVVKLKQTMKIIAAASEGWYLQTSQHSGQTSKLPVALISPDTVCRTCKV